MVERTLGRLGRWQRLAKNYEELPEVSEAKIRLCRRLDSTSAHGFHAYHRHRGATAAIAGCGYDRGHSRPRL